MKSPVDQLSYKEKQLLSQFYETDTYKALRHLIDMERLELAKSHVGQTDILQVRYLSGQTESLKKLVGTLQFISKDSFSDKKTKKS